MKLLIEAIEMALADQELNSAQEAELLKHLNLLKLRAVCPLRCRYDDCVEGHPPVWAGFENVTCPACR